MSRVRRSTVHAVGSLAIAQGLVAVASLVRLPFVIEALGADRFGAYVVVGSLAPVLMVTTAGARSAARALVAEEQGAGVDGGAALGASLAAARRVALVQAVVGLPIALVVGAALGGRLVGSAGGLALVLAVTVAGCSASTIGGAAWGWLEAGGRQALVHSLVAGVAAVGLLVTVVVARTVAGFASLAVVNVLTTVAPFLLALVLVPAEARRRRATTADRSAERAARTVLKLAAARAVPPLGARALDPFLIAPSVGATAAGTYGVGQRLSLVNTLVIQATAPVVAGDLARRRGSGQGLTMRALARIAVLQAAASGVLGLALVVVGPPFGRLLSHGELAVPRSLFVAFLVTGVAFSASEALASAASGPDGLALGWRVDGAGLVVNLVASAVLLEPFGMAGAVWGSALASMGTLAAWLVLLQRRPALRTETHGRPTLAPAIDPVATTAGGGT